MTKNSQSGWILSANMIQNRLPLGLRNNPRCWPPSTNVMPKMGKVDKVAQIVA